MTSRQRPALQPIAVPALKVTTGRVTAARTSPERATCWCAWPGVRGAQSNAKPRVSVLPPAVPCLGACCFQRSSKAQSLRDAPTLLSARPPEVPFLPRKGQQNEVGEGTCSWGVNWSWKGKVCCPLWPTRGTPKAAEAAKLFVTSMKLSPGHPEGQCLWALPCCCSGHGRVRSANRRRQMNPLCPTLLCRAGDVSKSSVALFHGHPSSLPWGHPNSCPRVPFFRVCHAAAQTLDNRDLPQSSSEQKMRY